MDPGWVWSRFSADPRDPGSAGLRATESDRHVVTEVLADAYADGRLDITEFEVRTASALALGRLDEVGPLLSDLVVTTHPDAALARPADLRERAVRQYQRDLRDVRNGWLVTSGITVGVWAVLVLTTGSWQYFWPAWPILGVGIGYAVTRLNRESRIEDTMDKLAEDDRRRPQ